MPTMNSRHFLYRGSPLSAFFKECRPFKSPSAIGAPRADRVPPLRGPPYQPSSIAPTGHCAAHAPQLTHLSASISYLPSPSEIAPTGHCPAHAPHEIQPSLITNAMTNTSFTVFLFNYHKYVYPTNILHQKPPKLNIIIQSN